MFLPGVPVEFTPSGQASALTPGFTAAVLGNQGPCPAATQTAESLAVVMKLMQA